MKIPNILLIILLITFNVFAQDNQSQNTPTNISNKNAVTNTNLTANAQESTEDLKFKISRLENEGFWLALLAALGFILPLPLGFYHIYRVRELVAQISDLEARLKSQNTKTTQTDTLASRNEKLEKELREIQEKFRTTMKNTQEKYQATIEKMKEDMHILDLENKRISGILMLKEQVAKKSSPGS